VKELEKHVRSPGKDTGQGLILTDWFGNSFHYLHNPAELGIFLFTTVSRLALGPTHLPTQWVPGILSLGVNQEADH